MVKSLFKILRFILRVDLLVICGMYKMQSEAIVKDQMK